jgi:integrase/recombinase XerC
MSDFENAHRGYIHHLEKERNLSVHTVRAYVGDLDSFFEHLTLQKVSSVGDISLTHIRSWLATQQVKGGARTTLSRRATSIRLFTKWATKNGYLAKDVGATLATPKAHRTLPDVLSVSDATTAMDSLATRVTEEDSSMSIRDCAIVELLFKKYLNRLIPGHRPWILHPLAAGKICPASIARLVTSQHLCMNCFAGNTSHFGPLFIERSAL